jgi:hypothetical protein
MPSFHLVNGTSFKYRMQRLPAPYWRCLPREVQAIFGDIRIGQR